jgi:hypothetical protein
MPRKNRYTPKVPPSPEYEKFLVELRTYCEPRGRKMNLARQMGVSPALVSLWLSGDRLLSLEDWIAIKKIMRRKR